MNVIRSLLSPEAQVVLGATRQTPQKEGRTLTAQPSLEWHRLLSLADRERAALPVWRAMRESGHDSGSDGAKALRRMAHVWEFRLIHLERLLHQALDAFRAEGIDAVLLKGSAAAVSVYGGFTHRPMIDIDLLVEPEQAEAAWSIARSLGWQWDDESYPREAYGNAHHLPPLTDEFGSGCGLEIHTKLWLPGNPFSFSDDDIRERAVMVDVAGSSCKVPRINHQLLHCCIHFAWSHRMVSHAWRAFSDVGAFVASGAVDWDEFVRLARSTGADTCCYWTLRLADRVADVAVPEGVLQALRPAGPDFVLDALERHYVMNLLPDGDDGPSVGLSKRLWQFGIRRGPGTGGIHLPAAPRPKGIAERISYHSKHVPTWYRYLKRLV